MAISKETAKEIKEVILKYMPLNQAKNLFIELSDIPGNSSFQKSIITLAKMLRETKPKEFFIDDKEDN